MANDAELSNNILSNADFEALLHYFSATGQGHAETNWAQLSSFEEALFSQTDGSYQSNFLSSLHFGEHDKAFPGFLSQSQQGEELSDYDTAFFEAMFGTPPAYLTPPTQTDFDTENGFTLDAVIPAPQQIDINDNISLRGYAGHQVNQESFTLDHFLNESFLGNSDYQDLRSDRSTSTENRYNTDLPAPVNVDGPINDTGIAMTRLQASKDAQERQNPQQDMSEPDDVPVLDTVIPPDDRSEEIPETDAQSDDIEDHETQPVNDPIQSAEPETVEEGPDTETVPENSVPIEESNKLVTNAPVTETEKTDALEEPSVEQLTVPQTAPKPVESVISDPVIDSPEPPTVSAQEGDIPQEDDIPQDDDIQQEYDIEKE